MPGNAVLSLSACTSDTCNGSTSRMAPAIAMHLLQPFLIADFVGTSLRQTFNSTVHVRQVPTAQHLRLVHIQWERQAFLLQMWGPIWSLQKQLQCLHLHTDKHAAA